MTASFLPTLFVPIIGLIFPFIFLAWFYSFTGKEKLN